MQDDQSIGRRALGDEVEGSTTTNLLAITVGKKSYSSTSERKHAP